MIHPNRFILRLAAAAALLAGSAAQAQETKESMEMHAAPTAEAMTFDLFVMRPLGLVGTVVGTAIFIISLPVDVIAMDFADPANRLVVEPAKFTFTRDLGDLD